MYHLHLKLITVLAYFFVTVALEGNRSFLFSGRYEVTLHRCRGMKARSNFTDEHVLGISPHLEQLKMMKESPSLGFEFPTSNVVKESGTRSDLSFVSKATCGKIWSAIFSNVSTFLTSLTSLVIQKKEDIEQDAPYKDDFDSFLLEIRHLRVDIENVIWMVSRLEFDYDGDCFKSGELVSKTRIVTPTFQSCNSFDHGNGPSCRFAEIFERSWCLAEYLEFSPIRIESKSALVQSLEAAMTNISYNLVGDSSQFGGEKDGEVKLDIIHHEEITHLPILVLLGRHLSNYGHLLLDNLFSLYVHLAAHDLLDRPLAIVATDHPEPTYQLGVGSMFEQIARTVCDTVAVAWDDLSTVDQLMVSKTSIVPPASQLP
jgi:hypothetical protein